MFNHINPNDYQSRLHNSIVRYGESPVWLQLKPGNMFTLAPLYTGSAWKQIDVIPTDERIDVSTPPLGWINYKYDGFHYAVYIERGPVRKWRQGLCSTNTQSYYLTKGRPNKFNVKELMYSKGFEDMILNRYDTLAEAIKKLNSSDCVSVAVSRNIAIGKKDSIYTIFYKKDEVGWMQPGKMLVKVPKEQHSHLISRFLREVPWEIE